jgi:hypothetical protein
MLKFISALDSDRATTDTVLTATIIRIVITTGPIGVTLITGLTIGTAGTAIITATMVSTIAISTNTEVT